MPKRISPRPIRCFLSGISLKNKKLSMVMKIYPVDSSIGDIERGTTFKAYMVIRVHRKKIAYAMITGAFRYSRSLESYFFSADFLRSICENDEISTLET